MDGVAYLGSQYEKFRPSLNRRQHKRMTSLWNEFTRLCKIFKLPFILYGGTLLGSHRHHDFIPWDDDIDVLMNNSYREKFVQYFSRLPGYQLTTAETSPGHSFQKFFKVKKGTVFRNSEGDLDFKWPFVDVFFYKENETHIFDAAWYEPPDEHWAWEKTRFFPLKQRPLAGEMFNVPCDVDYALEQDYKNPEYCTSNYYNHLLSTGKDSISIECRELYPYFPFVIRRYGNGTFVNETLYLNGTVLQTYAFKDSCLNEIYK